MVLIGHLTSCLQPFLPATTVKLAGMLNLPLSAFAFDQEIAFENGHQLNPSALLFEKVEDDVIDKQIQKLALTKKRLQNQKSRRNWHRQKLISDFETFDRMDIRTATILTAEKVAKTKKLLKLTIDTGLDQRTIVSGIAEYFEPEAVVGKKVSVLINLEPREIKGIFSQGMILMAEDADGKLSFVAAETGVNDGSVVR